MASLKTRASSRKSLQRCQREWRTLSSTTGQKFLGRRQTDRDSYDPAPILTAIPGGDRVMVLDLNDLPENWKDGDFRELISTTSSDEE